MKQNLLIVVQLASAQLTPRVIAKVFAERRIKWVLGIFTFAYTYTIADADIEIMKFGAGHFDPGDLANLAAA